MIILFLIVSYLSLCRMEKRTGMLLCGIDFRGWRAVRLSNRGSFSNREKRFQTFSSIRPEHEANHYLPYIAEIKNEWRYSSTPRRHLRSVYRDNFIFIFFISIFLYVVHLFMAAKVSES